MCVPTGALLLLFPGWYGAVKGLRHAWFRSTEKPVAKG